MEEEREEEGKKSNQLSQIAQEREQSLYWWATPWFSKCGAWNREISIIWESVTDANSWPYHWSSEWGSLELGHCNLSFNQLSRWWSQGKESKKWILLKLLEKLFLLKDSYTFRSWPENPTCYKSIKLFCPWSFWPWGITLNECVFLRDFQTF